MIIELKLKELIFSLAALNEIGKKKGLNFKFNYQIAKISKTIEPIVQEYEACLRKFINENGIYDENHGAKVISKKEELKVLQFNENNEELLEKTNKIEIDKIFIEDFYNYDIEAVYIRPLFWMIYDEPNNKKVKC